MYTGKVESMQGEGSFLHIMVGLLKSQFNKPDGYKDTKLYMCEICGTVFRSEWSREDAENEFKREYPKESIEDTVIVCDECYQKYAK